MTILENQETLCNKMSLEQQRKKIKELLHYQMIIDAKRKERVSNFIEDLPGGKSEK